MERNDAIITLEVLKANCSILSRDYQALKYAISSLKTDEAYQLMYEGGEIFTKADMVAMLTEIQLEIEELEVPLLYLAEDYEGGVLDCKKIIQQKIDALRKETNK